MKLERKMELASKYDHKATGVFSVPWKESCADIAEIVASLPESPLNSVLLSKYDPQKQQDSVVFWLVSEDVCSVINNVVVEASSPADPVVEASSSSSSVV